jgi:hypothetical protein
MKGVMKDNEHYGIIPGCGDKPALLKSGAEKLNLTFRMSPDPQTEIVDLGNGHREYRVKCVLKSIVTDRILGAGVGSASTMETKWRYRNAEPETTTKAVPQEYWNLRKKDANKAQEMLGGKGFVTKKVDGQWFIAKLTGEKVEYENPADYYNTCWKMAKKRSLVDAVLTVTAASDIFTQDVEEMVENGTIDKTDKKSSEEKNGKEGGEKKEKQAELPKNKSVITPIMDVRKVKDSEWFRIVGLLDANEQSFSTKDIQLAEAARKEKGTGLQFKIECDEKFVIISMAVQDKKESMAPADRQIVPLPVSSIGGNRGTEALKGEKQ